MSERAREREIELASLGGGGLCETMVIGLHLTSTSPPTCITKEPSGCLTEHRKSSSLSLDTVEWETCVISIQDICIQSPRHRLFMCLFTAHIPNGTRISYSRRMCNTPAFEPLLQSHNVLLPCLFYAHLWVDLFYVSCV